MVCRMGTVRRKVERLLLGEQSTDGTWQEVGTVRRTVERLLLGSTPCGHADTRGTCRDLYEHRLW